MALRSMVFTIGFSVALSILEHVPLDAFAYSTENGTSTILGPAVAGLINGFCCAQVVRGGSYTGGMDYVAALIRVRRPEINFFRLTFGINCVVAGISYFVYGYQIEPVILCVLYSFMSSTVSDKVVKSGRSAIRFEIVTDYPQELYAAIREHLHHGVTLIPGKGMYRDRPVSVLICVINKSQIAPMNDLIRSFPDTFAVMSQVGSVVGNFRQLDKDGNEELTLLDPGE